MKTVALCPTSLVRWLPSAILDTLCRLTSVMSNGSNLCVAIVDLLQLAFACFLHFAYFTLDLTLPQLSLQFKLAHVEVDRCQRRCHGSLGRLAT